MSQALIDLDITHEEFKTIVNEKEKYAQMKKIIRNIKSGDEISENSRVIKKIVVMHRFKNIIIFFCEYISMVVITVQAYKNAEVHTITAKNKKIILGKNVKYERVKSIKNIYDLARKEICGIFETKSFTEEQKRKYIRTEISKISNNKEISKILTDNSKLKYARSDLMEKIIKNCRGVKKCNDGINRTRKEGQGENFRILLGFKESDIMNREEHTVTSQIEQVFANEKIKPQYYIALYFPEHKLAVEVDEKAHLDRNEDEDKKKIKRNKRRVRL